jgi:hypothetical protein
MNVFDLFLAMLHISVTLLHESFPKIGTDIIINVYDFFIFYFLLFLIVTLQ